MLRKAATGLAVCVPHACHAAAAAMAMCALQQDKRWQTGQLQHDSLRYVSGLPARKATDTPWATAGCSEAVKIRNMTIAGQSGLVARAGTHHPAVDAASLADDWRVLELQSRPVRGRTYSLPSHSQQALFVAVGSP